MKKVFFFVMALMGTTSLMAGDYTHSVGALVGGMNGFSYKGFLTENLAIQADLGVGLTATKGMTMIVTAKADGQKDRYSDSENKITYSIWDFTVNPNLMYQAPISKGFSWFIGGGVNLGMGNQFAWTENGHRYTNYENDNGVVGKFGINAIGGVEYKFPSLPLVLGVDFRPGYGMAFDTENISDEEEMDGSATATTTLHYFDWKLALAIRYCF